MIRNVFRRALSLGLLVCFAFFAASPALHGQAETTSTLQKQLDRVDLGVSALGMLNSNSSGVSYANSNPRPAEALPLSLSPGNTLGALVTIRYTKSPLLGAEFNYSYSRFTQKFSQTVATDSTGSPLANFQVQANTSEISLGYVAHGPAFTPYAIRPFGAVGAGTTVFTPTTFGGQSLKAQGRATYYYAVGVEAPITSGGHFGFRAQVRQAFYLAPDFGQNYLTIKARTNSFEPAIGFYLHF